MAELGCGESCQGFSGLSVEIVECCRTISGVIDTRTLFSSSCIRRVGPHQIVLHPVIENDVQILNAPDLFPFTGERLV